MHIYIQLYKTEQNKKTCNKTNAKICFKNNMICNI